MLFTNSFATHRIGHDRMTDCSLLHFDQ